MYILSPKSLWSLFGYSYSMTFLLQLLHRWEDELNNVVQMGFVNGGGSTGAAPSGQDAEGILMSSSQLNSFTLTFFEQITKFPIFICRASPTTESHQSWTVMWSHLKLMPYNILYSLSYTQQQPQEVDEFARPPIYAGFTIIYSHIGGSSFLSRLTQNNGGSLCSSSVRPLADCQWSGFPYFFPQSASSVW